MSKQTFPMHLYAEEGYDSTQHKAVMRFKLIPWGADHNRDSVFGTYVGPVLVEAGVPDAFDVRGAKLIAKQAELQKVRGEMSARITQLMREINELQALPMAVAVADANVVDAEVSAS